MQWSMAYVWTLFFIFIFYPCVQSLLSSACNLVWQWHIAELLWSHSQVDTANLSSRWGSLTLVGCSSPGRKTLIPNLRYLAAKPNLGKGFGSKPRYEIRSWSPEGSSSLTSTSFWQLLRQHWCQAVWTLALLLDYISDVERGDPSDVERGTPVTWRGGPQ